MSSKVITLPDRDEMFERLLKITDNPHVRQRLYPDLLKQACQKYTTPQEVVIMLLLIIHDYVHGMPSVMADMIYGQAHRFIDALISDTKTAKEAKSFLQEALSETE